MTDHDRDARISLEGVDPEEALRALLSVDPDSEPVEPADGDEDDERAGTGGLPEDQ